MKRQLYLLALLLLLSATLLVFCACRKEGEILATPTVTINGDTVSWESNANAEKFEISIDGNLSYIESGVTSRRLENGQSFKIRAIGDGDKYLTGEWSNTVTYIAPIPTYTVVWKNGDTVLQTDTAIAKGSTPVYKGDKPTKAPTAQYTYEFAGWSPEIGEVKESITYNAVFTETVNCYNVTWKNGSVILRVDEAVEYGTTPAFDDETPSRPADADYLYVFVGWSPAIGAVVGDVTYYAEFEAIPNCYDIYWKCGDTLLETDEDVPYGSIPTYDGEAPTREATAQYTYEFIGWTPEINRVIESVTYVADFKENLRYYTVTFYSEDGSKLLGSSTVPYASSAVYPHSTPVKNATEEYTYVFEKWASAPGGTADDLSNVVSDRSVYACFKQFIRTVTVYVVSSNNDYGTVSLSALNGVPYGSDIIVSGNTITVNGQTVTANASSTTAQYTYTFTEWKTDSRVGNDTVIIAGFARTVNTYTVTWRNGDTILEIDENVPYGAVPVYNGATPQKSSDGNDYTFSGWSGAISPVVGDTEYQAQFSVISNAHTVIFYSDDGKTELGRTMVEPGVTAVYPNSLPTKAEDEMYTYTFDKWVTAVNGDTEARLDSITEDTAVYASFTASLRSFTVTFTTREGEIIATRQVEYGGAAAEPEIPEKEGYRFDSWDSSFDRITADATIVAQYVRVYTVTFLDHDGTILHLNHCDTCDKYFTYSALAGGKCPDCSTQITKIFEQYIDASGSAIAPELPEREGYITNGWDTSFSNIAADLIVKPIYIKQHTVTFLGKDGIFLKSEIVSDGGNATPPDAEVEGYTFVWDKDFSRVTADITVSAVYTVKKYTVSFVMPDGTPLYRYHCMECSKYYSPNELADGGCPDCSGIIIKEGSQTVAHGFPAIAPEHPELYTKKENGSYTVKAFSGWDRQINKVTGSVTVTAVYDSEYRGPVVILEVDSSQSTVALYIKGSSGKRLYAVELDIGYTVTDSSANIVIDGVTVNNAGIFASGKSSTENISYVINNNEKTFSLAWSNTAGESFSYVDESLRFTLSTSGGKDASDYFIITKCSFIIGDEGAENTERVSAILVYR